MEEKCVCLCLFFEFLLLNNTSRGLELSFSIEDIMCFRGGFISMGSLDQLKLAMEKYQQLFSWLLPFTKFSVY
jgi:hypothetical protein